MRVSELPEIDQRLVEEARKAALNAHAPISNYHVGAALHAHDERGGERIVAGCNFEHIVLGLSCCAERVAIQAAIAQGLRHFDAVAVWTVSSPPAAPCGSCRQVLHTWKVRRVVMANADGEVRTATIDELLPLAFDLEGPLK